MTNADEARFDEFHTITDEYNIIEIVDKLLVDNHQYIAGKSFGISDLYAFSILENLPSNKIRSKDTKNWIENCRKFISDEKSLQSQKEPLTGESNIRDKLFDLFTKNSIQYENIDHPEVFTVEAMMPYLSGITGAVCKNLFLKDKKGGLYLLSALHDRTVNLSDLGKKLKIKDFRFASEELLFQNLGVRQGCVTAYALMNDFEKKVKFLLDKDILSFDKVFFHPLVNNATTGISSEDFKKFVDVTGHEIVLIDF